MAFGRFRQAKEELEVNLIPVMNLFVTLIPFLLLAAAFYHVGVIPTSWPSQTDEKSDVAADPSRVTVDLIVEGDRIEISASNAVLDEKILEELQASLPKKDDAYDVETLQQVLYRIKERFAHSDTVIVLPSDGVAYQDIILILDAARELIINKGTEKEKKIPLFPVVVLSRKV